MKFRNELFSHVVCVTRTEFGRGHGYARTHVFLYQLILESHRKWERVFKQTV